MKINHKLIIHKKRDRQKYNSIINFKREQVGINFQVNINITKMCKFIIKKINLEILKMKRLLMNLIQ
jgi:hypothetical protein